MKDEKLLHEFTTLATFSDFDSSRINPSCHKARLRIMPIDSLSHNGIKFTREAIEKALPSLKNIPLVTQYDTRTNNLKSHEFESDGNALTYPIGSITESCQQWIEEVEVDGETKEYLCSEVIMWKRQKREYDFIRKHKELNVSMEAMMFNPKKNKQGIVEIGKFYFTAVTVLGVGVSPSFGEANIVFSKDSDQYQQMMFELNEFENGGNNMSTEGQTQTADTQTQVVGDPVGEGGQGNATTVADPNGQVAQNNTQTDEGDKGENKPKDPETDYKAKYEQLEAELSRTIVGLQKERDDLATQLQKAQESNTTQMTALQQELEELKQYKKKIEKDKLDIERQAILEQFTDLKDTEDYNEIIKNLDELAPNVLEDKLYIVAGRMARNSRKSQKQLPKTKLNIATSTQESVMDSSNPFAKFFM